MDTVALEALVHEGTAVVHILHGGDADPCGVYECLAQLAGAWGAAMVVVTKPDHLADVAATMPARCGAGARVVVCVSAACVASSPDQYDELLRHKPAVGVTVCVAVPIKLVRPPRYSKSMDIVAVMLPSCRVNVECLPNVGTVYRWPHKTGANALSAVLALASHTTAVAWPVHGGSPAYVRIGNDACTALNAKAAVAAQHAVDSAWWWCAGARRCVAPALNTPQTKVVSVAMRNGTAPFPATMSFGGDFVYVSYRGSRAESDAATAANEDAAMAKDTTPSSDAEVTAILRMPDTDGHVLTAAGDIVPVVLSEFAPARGVSGLSEASSSLSASNTRTIAARIRPYLSSASMPQSLPPPSLPDSLAPPTQPATKPFLSRPPAPPPFSRPPPPPPPPPAKPLRPFLSLPLPPPPPPPLPRRPFLPSRSPLMYNQSPPPRQNFQCEPLPPTPPPPPPPPRSAQVPVPFLDLVDVSGDGPSSMLEF